MAVTKTVVKSTHNNAVVKVINDSSGAASTTITLATDLLRSNETISGSPSVSIGRLEFSSMNGGAGIKIVRNSVVIMQLENSGCFELPFNEDSIQNTSDLVITLDRGTLIMHLLKNNYEPNYKPEQGIVA